MKKGLLAALVCGAFGISVAGPLAFPGALGFGANATGGRAGSVYHVTNLNDSGEGSFREAVSKGNRIVVFDVGGYIKLKSAVSMASNLTIAGQTAPGEGIGFRGGKISMGKQQNIIIRHIRVRPGSETASNKDVGINLYNARNVILDHVSIEFAPWNNIGGVSDDWQNYPVTDVTVQSSLIAYPTYQRFGAHVESVNSNWSWYYNAFASTHNRNPLDKVNDVFINNILYNFEAGYTTHTSTNFKHDIVANYFVYGPKGKNAWYQIDKNQSIYYKDNMIDTDTNGVLNGKETTPYWYQGTGTILEKPWSEHTTNNPVYSAATAFRLVTSLSGTLPYDDVDSLVWSEINSLGKKGTVFSSSSLHSSLGLSNDGYGEILAGEAPVDTDGDGMPDFWENAAGTDPSKDDAMTIGSDGYANIENYINWLAVPHVRGMAGETIEVDLREFTAGFQSVSPSYSVKAADADVSLAADGYTARFVSKKTASGATSFAYTVSGNDGTEYTGSVSVLLDKNPDAGEAEKEDVKEEETAFLHSGVASLESGLKIRMADGTLFAPREGFADVKIFDLRGNCVFRFARNVPAGISSLGISNGKLSKGAYAVRVRFE